MMRSTMAGKTVQAIDTNVLVRYITGDDEVQLERASRLIESGEPKLINPIVLVELSWVLNSVYRLSRRVIAETLKQIGGCGYFIYKRPQPIRAAIEYFIDGFDLADALILCINAQDGAAITYTFDRKAAHLPGYELLAS